ncbi:hypothetical protein YC2023_083335 [Brassica napus]
MHILRILIMVPHVSSMSKFLITTLVGSLSSSSRPFLPKLYGDYGFWNPSPVYGGGFPYPGPVPHGSLGSQQRHKKLK